VDGQGEENRLMPAPQQFPPFSAKYVLLGMLSEDMSRPPRDHPDGWIEYFWPAENPASLATFVRCLEQIQREAGITTTIKRPHHEGIVSSRELAREIDRWYGGETGLHYGMFPPPPYDWRHAWDCPARVSFLKGVLLRLRSPLYDPEAWHIAAGPIGWGCTLYHVLVDLDCVGSTMRYNPVEGGSLGITVPRKAGWMTRLFEQELPW
jgi:hypothetical protein